MRKYIAESELPVGPVGAFDYHDRPGALDRLLPPWQSIVIESSDDSLLPGSRVVLRMGVGPVSLKWVAEHTRYERPHLFADVQRSGPFSHWEHLHRFTDSGSGRCRLRDEISYELPAATISRPIAGRWADREIEAMFAYRHRVTTDDLELAMTHQRSPLTIAVSGSSGLVGQRLCSFLTLIGHRVIHLERSADRAKNSSDKLAPWDSDDDAEQLSGIDAVVHLAGKPIAASRWSESVKQGIRSSRVDLTSRLASILAGLDRPPSVLVCASASGFYGDRGDEELDETSPRGEGFLSDVAEAWEQSCRPAEEAGVRVVNFRFGVVLDPRGGALEKMLLPAKFMGGALGSGKQWWSWIALDDAIGGIYHAICSDAVSGPCNATAPNPVRNKDLAAALGRVLSRPSLVPAPAPLLKLAMGEMADALLLQSTRARPGVLQRSGYRFRFSDVEDTLRYCLGKDRLKSA